MNAAQRLLQSFFNPKVLPHPQGLHWPPHRPRGTPPRLRRPYKDRLRLAVIRGKLAFGDRVRLR